MVITISLVLLFGLVLGLLLKFNVIGYGAAFISVMFGFYLASTGAAAPINQLTAAVIDAIADL